MIFSTTLRKETSADRAGSSFRRTVIVLHPVTHHPTIGIDPTPVDDRDALVPLGRRSGIGPDASSGPRACVPHLADAPNSSRRGLTLRASLVDIPAFRAHV